MSKSVEPKEQIAIEKPRHLPEHEESLCGILADHMARALPPEQWDEIREAAWVEGYLIEFHDDTS